MSILCDGGQELGFGHITRCISIAQAFLKHGYKSEFIVNGDETIGSVLAEYTLHDWQNDNRLLEKIKYSSILLIDSMFVSEEKLLELESSNIPILFIDDEKQMNALEKGFVIDWTVMSEKRWSLLEHKEHVTYLLGSNFTPLRPLFSKAKKTIIKERIQSVMITFGGSDIRNLTPKILEHLTQNFPDITKNVVIGPGYKNVQVLETLKDSNTNLLFHVDTQKMISLMQNSDIAIASGGQTLYELSFIGTPTIAVLVVKNAKDDTEGWDKIGSVKNIGWYEDPHLLENLNDTLVALEKKESRVKMQESAKNMIRNDGASYLVDTILKTLARSIN